MLDALEGGMSKEWLVVLTMLPYTIVIIVGIHKYESRIKDLKGSISDYRRALSLSKDNNYSQQHYTQLQLENKNLRMSLYELDKDNDMLKRQLAQARLELLESRPLQYESSTYQHPIYANQQELEMDSLFERQIDFE